MGKLWVSYKIGIETDLISFSTTLGKKFLEILERLYAPIGVTGTNSGGSGIRGISGINGDVVIVL